MGPKPRPILLLSLILKPKPMPGEDMADMAVDTVDTVVDMVDTVDMAVVDMVDLLSLMLLPTMVDTTVDTVVDTMVDMGMVDMAVTVTVAGDAKGGPLNLMPMPLLMPGEATMAMAVMVTVVGMATMDKCHLSSQI